MPSASATPPLRSTLTGGCLAATTRPTSCRSASTCRCAAWWSPSQTCPLISREAIAGEGPGLLATSLGDIAVVTSYEVYFADLVRDGVRAGGRIIANPTLASSYSTSAVPAQSLASARLRAVETGRWVLQSSTSGYSAIVSPDGDIARRSELRGICSAGRRRRVPFGIHARRRCWDRGPLIVLAAAALGGHAVLWLRVRRE